MGLVHCDLVAASLSRGRARPRRRPKGRAANYTPGRYGNLAVALQPQPGSFAVINDLGYVSSSIDRAVLNNKAATNIDTKQVFVAPLGLYTFKTPILGGALFSAGGWLAFPWASLETTPNPLALPRPTKRISVIHYNYFTNLASFSRLFPIKGAENEGA